MNKVIYDSNDLKIEIPLEFHNYLKALKETRVKTLKVSNFAKNFIFKNIKRELEKEGHKCYGVLSSLIPVIEHNKELYVSEPFDIFELGLNYLSYIDNLDDSSYIIDEIESIYKQYDDIDGIVKCSIYNKDIEQVKGHFYYYNKKENKVYVLLWGFQEHNENDNEDEDDFNEDF